MMNVIIQLITGMLGSLGFALLFGLKRKYLLSAALGGFFGWGLYLLGEKLFNGDIFLACLLASAFCALYSEIVARVQKAPTTLFFITSVVPLIPGSTLYYTFSYVVAGDGIKAIYYGTRTLQYALAIAAGSCIIWASTLIIESVKKQKKS